MIRPLSDADLDAALMLSASAGWNQRPEDWRLLLSLSNCFGFEAEGNVVASISATCYGGELAWIGMVLTLPEQRGKGHASQLMTHAMDFLLSRGTQCIKLDATELGAPVYRKFGFEDECLVERWKCERGSAGEQGSEGGAIDWELDHAAFGADRRALLQSLASQHSTDVDAHAFLRSGRTASQFGPCVARTPEAAARVAQFGAGTTFWDLFPGNAHAAQLAHSCGFTPARKLMRMSYQGRDVEQDPALVYALAGFEWG